MTQQAPIFTKVIGIVGSAPARALLDPAVAAMHKAQWQTLSFATVKMAKDSHPAYPLDHLIVVDDGTLGAKLAAQYSCWKGSPSAIWISMNQVGSVPSRGVVSLPPTVDNPTLLKTLRNLAKK